MTVPTLVETTVRPLRASTLMPAHCAFSYLIDVRHTHEHLSGILTLLTELDPQAWHGQPADRAEWSFRPCPQQRVIHWQLRQPFLAAGQLHVHGRPSPCQLALSIDVAPPHWDPERVHSASRRMLAQLCDRLDDEHRRSETP